MGSAQLVRRVLIPKFGAAISDHVFRCGSTGGEWVAVLAALIETQIPVELIKGLNRAAQAAGNGMTILGHHVGNPAWVHGEGIGEVTAHPLVVIFLPDFHGRVHTVVHEHERRALFILLIQHGVFVTVVTSGICVDNHRVHALQAGLILGPVEPVDFSYHRQTTLIKCLGQQQGSRLVFVNAVAVGCASGDEKDAFFTGGITPLNLGRVLISETCLAVIQIKLHRFFGHRLFRRFFGRCGINNRDARWSFLHSCALVIVLGRTFLEISDNIGHLLSREAKLTGRHHQRLAQLGGGFDILAADIHLTSAHDLEDG